MAATEKQRSTRRLPIHVAAIDVAASLLHKRFFDGHKHKGIKLAAWAAFGASLIVVPACTTFPDAQITRGLGEQMVADAYPGMPETLTRRAVQDRAQTICSKIGHDQPSQAEAAEVVRLSRDS